MFSIELVGIVIHFGEYVKLILLLCVLQRDKHSSALRVRGESGVKEAKMSLFLTKVNAKKQYSSSSLVPSYCLPRCLLSGGLVLKG